MVSEKAELANKLNELLGTAVDLDRLSLNDLKELHSVFKSPGKLLQIFAKAKIQFTSDMLKKPINEVLGEPNILNKPLGEVLGVDDEDGGILGLGLLPKKGFGLLDRLINSNKDKSETDKKST